MRARNHTLSGTSLGAIASNFAPLTMDATAGASSSSGSKTLLVVGGLALAAGGIYMLVKKKR